ncbi:MAG: hypothetical protein Q9P01_06855 [Anaerolineae bacterium]|nr:hypothetical protein [Anaerolineae bacterium]
MFKALMIFATVVLLFALIVLCAYAWNLMTFPYDYDQGEGFELVDTILFSQFRSPYQNTDSYPFYSSNYPPLYHVIAAPFVWIFGESYWYGRLLSLLSALIAAIAIGFAVYREGGITVGLRCYRDWHFCHPIRFIILHPYYGNIS